MDSQVFVVPSGSDGRSKITRTRTGCLTCLGRKKKCDEARPACNNCTKTGFRCRWRSARDVEWKGGGTLRRQSRRNPNTTFVARRATQTSSSEDEVDWDSFIHRLSPEPSDRSVVIHGRNVGDLSNSTLGEIRYDHQSMISPSVPDRTQCRDSKLENFIPPSLPFPVIGVNTAIKKKLFFHFTSVMSGFLTTIVGTSNPFNLLVLPIARRDPTVMDALLSLAGAHIVKRHQPNQSMDLVMETNLLHGSALRQQYHRVQAIKGCSPESQPCEDEQLEVLFVTSLLLCLFEICEGSGNDSWRGHLNTAGTVLSLASTPPPSSQIAVVGPAPALLLATRIHPFFIEFYIYHALLAAVTDPSSSTVSPQYQQLFTLLHQDPSVVGVQDGLNNFVPRISALRNDVECRRSKVDVRYDGDLIAKAAEISIELDAWRPKQPLATKARNLITGFYQMALGIWLFSIINPSCRDDPFIQENVRKIATGLHEIQARDGVMACMLFPLFVAGSAAITDQDRALIRVHFGRLKEWSALGNIDLTFQAVEKMWQDYDNGVERSWDWVKQFEDFGMSVLIT